MQLECSTILKTCVGELKLEAGAEHFYKHPEPKPESVKKI